MYLSIIRHGYAARIVSVDRLFDLRDEIDAGHRNGLSDGGIYREYPRKFASGPPAEMPGARSLIIVATRQPQVRFTFEQDGKASQFVVPPTCLHAVEANEKIQDA